MTGESFCTYEQCVKLRELGFDYECNHYYNEHKTLCNIILQGFDYIDFNAANKGLSAPTLAQAQTWLRGKGWHVGPVPMVYSSRYNGESWFAYLIEISSNKSPGGIERKTYEEALSAGITECIKLLEKED